jgi:hypothetical protein
MPDSGGTTGAPTAPARPLWFELHIRPLFREIDRDHMLRVSQHLPTLIDLWDYASVTANRAAILGHVQADMPPPEEGGLWPQEWIDLFTRWDQEGGRQLPLATAQFTAKRDPATHLISLRAKGVAPVHGCHTWIEKVFQRKTPYEFIIYQEPPPAPSAAPAPAAPAATAPFSVVEQFDAPPDLAALTVTDAAGQHQVPIT